MQFIKQKLKQIMHDLKTEGTEKNLSTSNMAYHQVETKLIMQQGQSLP